MSSSSFGTALWLKSINLLFCCSSLSPTEDFSILGSLEKQSASVSKVIYACVNCFQSQETSWSLVAGMAVLGCQSTSKFSRIIWSVLVMLSLLWDDSEVLHWVHLVFLKDLFTFAVGWQPSSPLNTCLYLSTIIGFNGLDKFKMRECFNHFLRCHSLVFVSRMFGVKSLVSSICFSSIIASGRATLV